MQGIDKARRRMVQWLSAAGGLFAVNEARAIHTDTHWEDTSRHQIIYQCNKADHEYMSHILFSVGELIRRHEDEVMVVVACFGQGIHLLGKKPGRPIAPELQERASSLAAYGVAFHACGNTMKSLKWGEEDLVSYAKVVPIGVEDIMLLQEKGYSYFSW